MMMTGGYRRLGALPVIGAVIAGASCGEPAPPAPGAACSATAYPAGSAVCQAATALLCASGTFTAIPCSGPAGCRGGSVAPFADRCDISGNEHGAPCLAALEGLGSCATGGTGMVVCNRRAGEPGSARESRFERIPCRGPAGCAAASQAGPLSCDQRKARIGDYCSRLSTGKLYTCSDDGKALLRCEGAPGSAAWQMARACGGPKGCVSAEGPNAACDSTVADAGDRCQPGQVSCSRDGKQLLHCLKDKLAVSRQCREPSGCTTKWTSPQRFEVLCN